MNHSPYEGTYQPWRSLSDPLRLPPKLTYDDTGMLPSFGSPGFMENGILPAHQVGEGGTASATGSTQEQSRTLDGKQRPGYTGLKALVGMFPSAHMLVNAVWSLVPTSTAPHPTLAPAAAHLEDPIAPTQDDEDLPANDTASGLDGDPFAQPLRKRKMTKVNKVVILYGSDGSTPLTAPPVYSRDVDDTDHVVMYVHRVPGSLQTWIWENGEWLGVAEGERRRFGRKQEMFSLDFDKEGLPSWFRMSSTTRMNRDR